ncbi:MAG: hypothetical protein MZU95_05685 [Desulfomicrobium escambiense]|nr:hypothetical protein [Desulfomicrobium escambiense]
MSLNLFTGWLARRSGSRRRAGVPSASMNEAYFLYFEDVEWCRRAWKSGMEVWRVPEAVIIHECRRQSAGGSGRAARLHFRSMIRFFATHPSALAGKGPGPS